MAENNSPDNPDKSTLYPSITPYDSGMLDVGDGHEIYWEENGNKAGPAVIFLHGGPGAGCATSHRRFFDPDHWRIVLFDQRGSGRSTPKAGVEDNTTQKLVADIEKIRAHLDIDRWLVFGGSWGSTLGLVYGITHPDRCSGFILRGIFLGSDDEVNWFMEDMGRFFPAAHRKFIGVLPENERSDVLGNFYRRLNDPDPDVHGPAANAWSNYESSCARLIPPEQSDGGGSLSLARMEAHYFVNDLFLSPDFILNNLDKISHLPCIIVQGRYDVICPPFTAEKLALNWPGAILDMINDAGHSAFETGIVQALVKATNSLKN